jgi:hypothetical protein
MENGHRPPGEPSCGPPSDEHLRRAVWDFVASAGRRRALPLTAHVGHPAGAQVQVVDLPWYDAAARADLITRALDGLEESSPFVWLTRPGELRPADTELAWCAAAITAFARHQQPLPGVYLITRVGWTDLLTGRRRTWRRVRPHGPHH